MEVTLPFCISRDHRLCCISVPEGFFILANSEDPEEEFHQGLHCLLKYLLAGIQNQKR